MKNRGLPKQKACLDGEDPTQHDEDEFMRQRGRRCFLRVHLEFAAVSFPHGVNGAFDGTVHPDIRAGMGYSDSEHQGCYTARLKFLRTRCEVADKSSDSGGTMRN